MPITADLDALARAVAAQPGFAGVTRDDLEPLPVTGLAHDHIAICGRGMLLRVPKQSQFALPAHDNLTYQAACFERVSASGHGPRLHGVIAPVPDIPMGALVVDYVIGRPPRLPEDLGALALAMARVHALPVPAPAARPPLADHTDPFAGALAEVERQAAFIPEAGLDPGARSQIEAELAWARGFTVADVGQPQPITLVLTDTHPGNFLVRDDGTAVIVDLEKALYGSPGTDLAHHSIYTSTTWDLATYAELTVDDVAAFYRAHLAAVPAALARQLRPWLIPMRRLTWLRAVTWCIKWHVAHRRARRADKLSAGSTEDWSAENSDPALIAHVAGRVAEYLRPDIVARVRAEWLGDDPLDHRI